MCDERLETAQIGSTFAFGSAAQSLERALLIVSGEGLEEQARMGDQTLARGAVGVLVVLKPEMPFPGGQRRRAQRAQDALRVFGVGARQRGEHPGGGPGRELTVAHGSEGRLGQPGEQLQPPAHPTDIASAPASQFVLGQPQTLDELAQEQRLLDRGEAAPLGAAEHGDDGLGEVTGPAFDAGGIATEPAQGRDAPIAVDQYQSLAICIGHGNAGDQLAAPLDGAGEVLDRARLHEARIGKAQFHAVQVEFQVLRVETHGATVAAAILSAYHVLSLQDSPGPIVLLESRVICTVHASIFARLPGAAGASR